MSARILIAYATRHGSTAEIASAVGKELENAGRSVVVKELKEVTSLEEYDAILIGGSMYTVNVIDINTFLERFKATLAGMPVAAFPSGSLLFQTI